MVILSYPTDTAKSLFQYYMHIIAHQAFNSGVLELISSPNCTVSVRNVYVRSNTNEYLLVKNNNKGENLEIPFQGIFAKQQWKKDPQGYPSRYFSLEDPNGGYRNFMYAITRDIRKNKDKSLKFTDSIKTSEGLKWKSLRLADDEQLD